MTIGRLRLMSVSAVALGCSTIAPSQQFSDEPRPWSVPSIPDRVAAPSEFVPAGWKMVSIQRGDLNRDRLDDVAVLMRMADPSRIIDTDSKYYPKDDQNPYLLVVGFANARSGYRRVAVHHQLLPSLVTPMHGNTVLGDDSISIRRGVLAIAVEHIRGHETWRFRWDGRDLALIGYDCGGVAGGTAYGLSANYSTLRAKAERGPIDQDKLDAWTVRIKPGKRPTLNNINLDEDWIGEGTRGEILSC